MLRLRFTILALIILVGLLFGITIYGGMAQKSKQQLALTPETNSSALTLAPEAALPDFVQDAAPQVKEAYRFAIANPDVLRKFPCYCGCGAMGHRHNLECYIKEFKPDGSIVFENHAFGWTVCIDITRDVMRLLSEGQDLKTIRAYIDQTYSKYGAPTQTEPIQ